MRCLFTMFAEDVGLLPRASFVRLLEQVKATPKHFVPALQDLWRVMDEGGYASFLNDAVKRFNGTLFKERDALPLESEDINELLIAAKRDWRDVEPAIFGTLLERALEVKERAQLGAHYTPRVYVERLIIPTLIEPLRDDWAEVKARAQDLGRQGKPQEALKAVRDFHHRLCTTRVLDPACGSGNFLYVALELMKRIEGEVLEALDDLGLKDPRLSLQGETVSPEQFFGLEINPRAVVIADLVLWLGFLKWQLRTVEADRIEEPILRATNTIRKQDALLSYKSRDLVRDQNGKPRTVWDGYTMKEHPITGAPVPDETARKETYRYTIPAKAVWPEVEFIVGNPPFIGGKDLRAELGDGMAEALWAVRPDIPGGADLVMHFWDHAAELLVAEKSKLKRFGFITTNSVTQTFSRRVIERYMGKRPSVSLIFAIPDHPWLKQAGKAAVRIAMTVAEKSVRDGTFAITRQELSLDTDTPQVELDERVGKIQANLQIGPDLLSVQPLLSNDSLCHMGIKLHGAGFMLDGIEAKRMKSNDVIKPFVNGRDLVQKSRNNFVIDLYGKSLDEIIVRYPSIYQHLLNTVKPERDQNRRDVYKKLWWIWGEPRKEWRSAVTNLSHYIATTRTAKHRIFTMLDRNTWAESKIVAIASSDYYHLAVLSSRPHILFATRKGGFLGVGNDPTYQHTDTFNPFPFPVVEDKADKKIFQLRKLGERLERFRKERLGEHRQLTMTNIYNVCERVRELESGCSVPSLNEVEKDIYEAGLVSTLTRIHDEIDEMVLAAYGWSDLGLSLVGKPGGTAPSPYKSAEQEVAESELLFRLVALNQARAADEKRGVVHWLRPDYQIPRMSKKIKRPGAEQIEADMPMIEAAGKPDWPSDGLEQIRAMRDLLIKAATPVEPLQASKTFSGRSTPKRTERVAQVLETLASTGAARTVYDKDGKATYFVPR